MRPTATQNKTIMVLCHHTFSPDTAFSAYESIKDHRRINYDTEIRPTKLRWRCNSGSFTNKKILDTKTSRNNS
jgi:hypothetical protein